MDDEGRHSARAHHHTRYWRMKRISSQRGSILIIVLWICIGLAAIALTFAHSSSMAYKGADNELAGEQAQWAIEGGVQYVMDLLTNNTTPGIMLQQYTYEAEALPLGEATIWLLAGAGDDTSYTATQPVFGLVDEASKININATYIVDGVDQLPQILENLPGMTEELANAIKDWRDADEDVTDSGAESETYAARQPAYASKNKPFESLEELALVNGGTFEVLYGEDANMNGVLDPNEDDADESAPADNSDGKLEPGIMQYITCFSRESNKGSDGTTPKADVSKRSDALITLLDNTLGDAREKEMMVNIGAATSTSETTWKITSVMEFYIDSQMTADELGQIINDIWIAPTDGTSYVQGLININTASEVVLGCIPGIGPEKAGAIVSARGQQTQQDANIAWFRDAIGDDQAAKLAGRFITGHSFQVSADIAAVGRHGRGYRRTRFVIDSVSGTPQVVYRRDLTSLGWALGSTTRATLGDRKEEAK